MNKIYKVVWSKVKNCYVVVSEIAKNVISGSVKSAKVGMVPVVKGMALGALMAFVITGSAWAENSGGIQVNNTTYEVSENIINVGAIDAGNSSNVNLSGTESVSVTVNEEGNDTVAINAWNDSNVTIKAPVFTVTAKNTSEENPAGSVQAHNGSTVKVDATTASITGIVYAGNDENYTGNKAQVVISSENTAISGTGTVPVIQADNNGTVIIGNSSTKTNVTGDIYVDNGGGVRMLLGTKDSVFTGATEVGSNDGAIVLGLYDGATWKVTENSNVSKVSGNNYNIVAAEGVEGVKVTIDGDNHEKAEAYEDIYCEEIDDPKDGNSTVINLSGVDLAIIDEEGGGLEACGQGSNTVINSNSNFEGIFGEVGVEVEGYGNVSIIAKDVTFKTGEDTIYVTDEVVEEGNSNNIGNVNTNVNGSKGMASIDASGNVSLTSTNDFVINNNSTQGSEVKVTGAKIDLVSNTGAAIAVGHDIRKTTYNGVVTVGDEDTRIVTITGVAQDLHKVYDDNEKLVNFNEDNRAVVYSQGTVNITATDKVEIKETNNQKAIAAYGGADVTIDGGKQTIINGEINADGHEYAVQSDGKIEHQDNNRADNINLLIKGKEVIINGDSSDTEEGVYARGDVSGIDNAVITIGDVNTEKVSISYVDSGLVARNAGSRIEVNSNTFVISANGNNEDSVDGIVADNESNVSDKFASVYVNASKTEITVQDDNFETCGIGAYGKSNVNVIGDIDIVSNGYSAYGVEAVNGSNIELGSDDSTVSLISNGNGDSGEAIAVYAENANSKVNVTAKTLTVNATSKNVNQPGSSLQAKDGGMVNVIADTANVTGMMYAGGSGSRINVTASTAANIKGDILTQNNGVVVLALKGENASFTGATKIESAVEEENSSLNGPVLPNQADKGTTLVLEDGATWYVTESSIVNGIIGDKFDIKAAEGVIDAVVTIDGHLPYDIDDDYNDTVSTITGVEVVINEEGDGLGGNVTLDSDSDITVNATERGIYAEEDTNVNIKAATLTLNNQVEYNAIEAEGTVNIEAANLVFEGNVIASGESSNVNITTGDFAYDSKKQFATVDNGVINIAGGNITGELNVIGGNVNLVAGNVASTLNIAKNSTVTLAGATYTTSNLKDSIIGEGKLTLTDKGVLKTIASQVFTVGGKDTVTTDKNILDGNTISDTANQKITFKSGSLSLNDDYSYEYLSSITDVLKNHSDNTTKIVMTGTLVKKDDTVIEPEDDKMSVDDASDLGSSVELDKVTVEADNNLLIGAVVPENGNINVSVGDDINIEVEDSVEKGFSANQLDLGEGSTGVVITGGQEIVLGGSQNDTSEKAHEVITVGGKAEEVIIVVGTEKEVSNAKETKGTLSIGNSAAKETDKYQLTGKAVINKDGELKTKGETTITKGVELKDGGKVYVEKGHHLKADIKAEGENNVIKGKVTSKKLEAKDQNTRIHLGDKDHAGKMHAKESKLNGGTLFLDPAYAKGIDEGSAFALEEASNLDGAYIAGQNSTISFGVTGTEVVEEVFAKTGLSFGNEGDVDAVVYIAGTTDVTGGSITANGKLTSATSVDDGTVVFASNSLLMVDADDAKSSAIITNVKTASIASDAKLYIDAVKIEDIKNDETFTILEAATGGTINATWLSQNISTNNQLIKFVDVNIDGKVELKADIQKVNDVYGKDVIIGEVVDEAIASGANSSDRFNAAVDEKVNAGKATQIDALNSIGSINELAGVTHTTYAVNNILTDAVADHMSLANGNDHDKDIWAHYVHTKEQVDGLKRAGSYDSQYNGIVVGADLYKEDKGTVGAALTYVDGNINGSTLASRTENDAKYYGASIYGSIKNEDTAVIADVSYLHGEHDITQRNSGKLIMGEPESDAFSVGVRVEKSTKAGIGKLVPYAGLRYMHLGSGNYSNSIGLTYDADDAELFLLPVGLKYSSEVRNTNGWTVRPLVELGYVWAFGDTDANQTVSLNGVSNGFGYDVTDSGSYVGRFLLEAEKSNISYALGYEYQKGDSVEADKWMFNVNWKF